MNWLILLPPLLAAVINGLFFLRNKRAAVALSVLACAVSLAGAVLAWSLPEQFGVTSFAWLDLPGLQVDIGATIDPLSRLMLLVVTGVGLMIHVFSIGYMGEDPDMARFFTKLSLFMFSMLGIVLADNLLMLFIFWELVGLSSYLLIGFWHERPSAAEAAKKAFIVNRLGDFGFLLGILGAWLLWGTLDFVELFGAIHSRPISPDQLWAVNLVAVGLFMGCVGKSAQLPLHVWLPDAMEGPTPVSALIHAATMVAAGVYMLCRVFFVLQLSSLALVLIACIGAATALFAALIALQQNDIKRILAYSTLSQLGYMVMAVGLSATIPAMFHLTTHAFFKALLFLAAGSVIYGMHHEQDIWKMGGLFKRMKATSLVFLVGTLALIGCPPFAGFFSKETILLAALQAYEHAHSPLFLLIFIAAAFTAGLTAFYMTRLVLVVFFGGEKSHAASHAHESPWVMVAPLLVLAVLSAVGGFKGFGIETFLGMGEGHHEGPAVKIVLGCSLAMLVLGVGLACWIYRGRKEDPVSANILANKFYSDEIYKMVFVGGQQMLARASEWFDRWIIGGLFVRGAGVAVAFTGELLRLFQGGNLQAYAMLFIMGVLVLCYWIMTSTVM